LASVACSRHVMLPVLGTIKTHESTRKLHRRIAGGTAKVNSATVRREAGRWFVSFTVEVQRTENRRGPRDHDARRGLRWPPTRREPEAL
jgi:hypothetical protein